MSGLIVQMRSMSVKQHPRRCCADFMARVIHCARVRQSHFARRQPRAGLRGEIEIRTQARHRSTLIRHRKEKLQPLIQNFFGDIGNFAQNSHGFAQNAQLGISTASSRHLAGRTVGSDGIPEVVTFWAKAALGPDPLVRDEGAW